MAYLEWVDYQIESDDDFAIEPEAAAESAGDASDK
jgi:hypothetical protein